jgi:hypothetical protein
MAGKIDRSSNVPVAKQAEALLYADPIDLDPEVRAELIRAHGQERFLRMRSTAGMNYSLARPEQTRVSIGDAPTAAAPKAAVAAPEDREAQMEAELYGDAPQNMSAASREYMDRKFGAETARRMRLGAVERVAAQTPVGRAEPARGDQSRTVDYCSVTGKRL